MTKRQELELLNECKTLKAGLQVLLKDAINFERKLESVYSPENFKESDKAASLSEEQVIRLKASAYLRRRIPENPLLS